MPPHRPTIFPNNPESRGHHLQTARAITRGRVPNRLHVQRCNGVTEIHQTRKGRDQDVRSSIQLHVAQEAKLQLWVGVGGEDLDEGLEFGEDLAILGF